MDLFPVIPQLPSRLTLWVSFYSSAFSLLTTMSKWCWEWVWKDVGFLPIKAVVSGLAMSGWFQLSHCLNGYRYTHSSHGPFIRFVRNKVWKMQLACTALIKKIPFHYFAQFFSGVSNYGLGDLPNAESRCYGSNKDSIASILPSLKESQATKWSQLPCNNLACHLGSTHTFCFLLSRVPSLGSLPRRKSVAVFYYFPAGPNDLLKTGNRYPSPDSAW